MRSLAGPLAQQGHNLIRELSSCAAAATAARPDTANAAVTVAMTVPVTLAAQFNLNRRGAAAAVGLRLGNRCTARTRNRPCRLVGVPAKA